MPRLEDEGSIRPYNSTVIYPYAPLHFHFVLKSCPHPTCRPALPKLCCPHHDARTRKNARERQVDEHKVGATVADVGAILAIAIAIAVSVAVAIAVAVSVSAHPQLTQTLNPKP